MSKAYIVIPIDTNSDSVSEIIGAINNFHNDLGAKIQKRDFQNKDVQKQIRNEIRFYIGDAGKRKDNVEKWLSHRDPIYGIEYRSMMQDGVVVEYSNRGKRRRRRMVCLTGAERMKQATINFT